MNWNNVSIGQYKRLQKLFKEFIDKKAEEEDNIKFVSRAYSILSGKTIDEILDLPATEFIPVSKEIEFLGTEPKGVIDETVTVNGNKYIVPIDVRKVTTAQYIDYTELTRRDPENIAMMCAIFCVPEGKKYNEGYNVSDLAEEFEDSFRIVDAIGISFFFTELLRTSVKSTLGYLKSELKKELKKVRKNTKTKEKIEAIEASIAALTRIGGAI